VPNPLGRRRIEPTSAESKEEISRLEKELNDLRKLYLQDMANVSSDMRSLVAQLSTTASVPPEVTTETQIEVSTETPAAETTVTAADLSLE
jgi:archaellum component FlaC